MTDTHRDTIMRLMVEVGTGCATLANEQMRELVRLHRTLRVTPAMAANVTDRVLSLEELVDRTSK
jgi:hypothetical protein